MDALHALVAEAQTAELERAIEAARQPRTITVTEEGQEKVIPNPAYAPIPASLLAVVAKFLKDNSIDTPATAPRISNILHQLQNINVDELPAN
jgi:hypothetical protein